MDTRDTIVHIARELSWWDRHVYRKISTTVYAALSIPSTMSSLGILASEISIWPCSRLLRYLCVRMTRDIDPSHDPRIASIVRLANRLAPRALRRELYYRGFYNCSIINAAATRGPAVFESALSAIHHDTGYLGILSAAYLSLEIAAYLPERPHKYEWCALTMLPPISTMVWLFQNHQLPSDVHLFSTILELMIRDDYPRELILAVAISMPYSGLPNMHSRVLIQHDPSYAAGNLSTLAIHVDRDTFIHKYTSAGAPQISIAPTAISDVCDLDVFEYLLTSRSLHLSREAYPALVYACTSTRLARALLRIPHLSQILAEARCIYFYAKPDVVRMFNAIDRRLLCQGVRQCVLSLMCCGPDWLRLWCLGEVEWRDVCEYCIRIVASTEYVVYLHRMPGADAVLSQIYDIRDIKTHLDCLQCANKWNLWDFDSSRPEIIDYLRTAITIPINEFANRIYRILLLMIGYSIDMDPECPIYRAYQEACQIAGCPANLRPTI